MWSDIDYVIKMGQEQVNKLNEAIIKISKEVFRTYDEATRQFSFNSLLGFSSFESYDRKVVGSNPTVGFQFPIGIF